MNKNSTNIKHGNFKKITKEELRERIEGKLLTRGVSDVFSATEEQLYQASVLAMKDIMLDEREEFKKRARAVGAKKICYLCMEFLLGRALKNDAMRLGIFDELSSVLSELGSSFEKVYAIETDPGLGNGGLGRLAACFIDSLTAKDYLANGYSLLYENGLFKQRIVDGEQVELADEWLSSGGVRLVPRPERSVSVKLGGRIEEKWEKDWVDIVNYDYEEIKAVPYDLLIPGGTLGAVNTVRLWRAKEAYNGGVNYNQRSGYIRRTGEGSAVENITKQLYPRDDYDEGKLLRLTQQYLLVSASLQSIITDYLAENGSLSGFGDKVAIHINDTHPALCIPELMRILMDVYSYSWDDAWSVVIKTVSYTNHTVLPEALECWRVDLFSMKLPRIYMIVSEINRRFTADLWNLYPGDWDRISRMSIVAYNQVRMANLSVVGSHTVNGVSKLHSDILKKSVFHDFYKMTPWKFTNVTNGIYHRRWLISANAELSDLLDGVIGTEYRENPEALIKLMDYKDDKSVLSRLCEIKAKNKRRFAEYASSRFGVLLNPECIFDVQIKRMHEYKRQLLNILKILSLYTKLSDNPNMEISPQTFIFGSKAAPGYAIAKKFIKLIWFLSRELEKNPATKDKIKVLFAEDYNVSVAELLIPAADISEQISLAGKEASGTGCMKLMMNGALTLGTLDGANVEILEAVGRENAYIFGLNAREVDELWRGGYNSRLFYHTSEELRSAVDRLNYPIGGENFSYIADYLLGSGSGTADPFMCLADFDSYMNAHKSAVKDYGSSLNWAKKSLVNVAKSGIFSSDNSVVKYADNIWHAEPVNKIKP